MNSDYEKKLDIEIGTVLKDLPELEAPDALVTRVMIRLERRSRIIWYRRSWQTWPLGLQTTSLLVLIVLFGGLCYAGLELSHADLATTTGQRVGGWFSNLSAVTSTLMILLNSFCLVVKKLGTGVVVACLFAIGLGYVMCVGLGTVYMRLTFAKH
jgi:hypothetical protein